MSIGIIGAQIVGLRLAGARADRFKCRRCPLEAISQHVVRAVLADHWEFLANSMSMRAKVGLVTDLPLHVSLTRRSGVGEDIRFSPSATLLDSPA